MNSSFESPDRKQYRNELLRHYYDAPQRQGVPRHDLIRHFTQQKKTNEPIVGQLLDDLERKGLIRSPEMGDIAVITSGDISRIE